MVFEAKRFRPAASDEPTPGPADYSPLLPKKPEDFYQNPDPSFRSGVERVLPAVSMHEVQAPQQLAPHKPAASRFQFQSATDRFDSRDNGVPGPGQYLKQAVFKRVAEKLDTSHPKKGFRFHDRLAQLTPTGPAPPLAPVNASPGQSLEATAAAPPKKSASGDLLARPLPPEYDKGVGCAHQCVLWKFGSRFSHRAQLFINREASDPQAYAPKEYLPRYKQGLSPQFKPCPRDCVQPLRYAPLTSPYDTLPLQEKAKVLPGPGAYNPPSAFEQSLSKKASRFSAKSLKSLPVACSFLGLQRASKAAGTPP